MNKKIIVLSLLQLCFTELLHASSKQDKRRPKIKSAAGELIFDSPDERTARYVQSVSSGDIKPKPKISEILGKQGNSKTASNQKP